MNLSHISHYLSLKSLFKEFIQSWIGVEINILSISPFRKSFYMRKFLILCNELLGNKLRSFRDEFVFESMIEIM